MSVRSPGIRSVSWPMTPRPKPLRGLASSTPYLARSGARGMLWPRPSTASPGPSNAMVTSECCPWCRASPGLPSSRGADLLGCVAIPRSAISSPPSSARITTQRWGSPVTLRPRPIRPRCASSSSRPPRCTTSATATGSSTPRRRSNYSTSSAGTRPT